MQCVASVCCEGPCGSSCGAETSTDKPRHLGDGESAFPRFDHFEGDPGQRYGFRPFSRSIGGSEERRGRPTSDRGDAWCTAKKEGAPSPKSRPTAENLDTKSDLLGEVGVYVVQGNKVTPVEPEIVNWRTGGVLKTLSRCGLRQRACKRNSGMAEQ